MGSEAKPARQALYELSRDLKQAAEDMRELWHPGGYYPFPELTEKELETVRAALAVASRASAYMLGLSLAASISQAARSIKETVEASNRRTLRDD